MADNFLNWHHGIASYPKNFAGCVVSENKICLQFGNPELKLRVDDEFKDNLKRDGGYYILPVSANSTPIRTLAVGCRLDVVNDLQNQLLDAYAEHIAKFGKTKRLYDIIDNIKERLEDL